MVTVDYSRNIQDTKTFIFIECFLNLKALLPTISQLILRKTEIGKAGIQLQKMK